MSIELASRVSDELVKKVRKSEFEELCLQLLQVVRQDPKSTTDQRWHPLGFAVVSWTLSPVTQLRLHVWPHVLHEEKVVDHRHDHRWSLYSYILCGSLVEHELRLRDVRPEDNQENILQIAEIEQERGIDQAILTPRQVVIARDTPKPQRRGDTYRVPAGQFHWSEPGQHRPVATFVRSDVQLDRGPLTLIPCGRKPLPAVDRDLIKASELAELLDHVLAEL